MLQKIKVVSDREWKFCPHCKSEIIGALRNGFLLDGSALGDKKFQRISTDLMLCFDCKKLYVVLPDWFFKRRPRKREEYPKEISLEIDEELMEKAEEDYEAYQLNRVMYERLFNPVDENLNK